MPEKMRPGAVLFDFDGVLAKTMEDNFNAWRAALEESGIAIVPDDYYPLEGMKVHEVAATLFRKYGREAPDPAAIVRRKESHYRDHNRFELYPGVVELLDDLAARRVPVAVATAALVSRLKETCPPGFLERFDALVTGDDAVEGKPSPAPYLTAAMKLNIDPSRCVVIENAPLGIRSAKAAGCYCIALETTMDRRYLAGADEILRSFGEIRGSEKIRALLEP